MTKHIFTVSVLQHTQSALKRVADDPATLVADPGEWYSRRDLGHMWSMHGCQNQCSRPVLLPIIICRTTMSSVNSQTFSRDNSKVRKVSTQSEKKKAKRETEKKEEKYDILSCTPTSSPFPLSYYSNILRWPRPFWIQTEKWSCFSFTNLWRKSKINVLLAILCSYVWSSAVIIIGVLVSH